MTAPVGALGRSQFPKALRVRRRAEFLKIQSSRNRVGTEVFTAVWMEHSCPENETRLGLTVSKKVGNAVVRNRVRRLLRELFRKRRSELPKGLDLVLLANPRAADTPAQGFEEAFSKLVRRLAPRMERT